MIRPVSTLNSVNFGKIYKNPDINFSDSQNTIAKDIVRKLRTPDQKGQTIEQKFEKRNGDFYLDGAKNNSVGLSLVFDLKEATDNEPLVYSGETAIGTYNKSTPFETKDINKAVKKDICKGLAPILAFIGTLALLWGIFTVLGAKTKSLQKTINNTTIVSKDSVTDTISKNFNNIQKGLSHGGK